MAKNKVELILTAKCIDGKVKWNNPDELSRFAVHHDGHTISAKLNLVTDISEKERMFAYLFGPLLDTVQTALMHHGYGQLSKKDCYLIMKDRYGKQPWYNPLTKKEMDTLVDFSDEKTTKVELLNFITNIIMFLEQDLGFEPPDSETYKIQQRLGSSRSAVKSTNYDEDYI